ncbi:MAG: sensor histidine kinase [Rectinemataceae bacterium]
MAAVEALSPDQFFTAAVLSSPDMISISLLEDGTYIEVNDAFLATMGYRREEVVGKTSGELDFWAAPDGRERFRRLLESDGRVRDFDILFRVKCGDVRQFQVSAAVVRMGGRDCITSVCRDVTERNEMVQRLEESRFLLERAEEMANIGSWEFDYRSGKVTASQGACRIYGLEEGEFSVSAIESVPLPEYRAAMDRARDSLVRDGVPYDIEFRIARRSDGAVRDIHSKARWDPAKRRLFGIIRDITEEKANADGLGRALEEKETLLKELYHRTRNNMQVMISLLNIEEEKSPDPRVREVFAQVQQRIGSMSLVHEMLYRSKDLSHIDLADFVSALVGLLKASLGDGRGRVSFAYEVEKVDLLMDAAVPCGIVLNELITNALIHAFPGRSSGTISIRAGRSDGGPVRIEVRDDGVGVPGGLDPEDGSNLGLWLVSNIVRSQLRGSVVFEIGGAGFGCVLQFDDRAFEARV